MSITILRQTVSIAGLEEQGLPARPLSSPPCRFSGIDVDLSGAGESKTGIWECTPGKFERQLVQAEVMHILSGACTFTPTGGEARAIRAGDTLFFPEDTRGVWEVTETLRKVFVVFG
ncbi:cupin domain-containing protein [Paracidovorax anthurii]|uniref:Transcriptional regulator n=1 Tax=Paracidovorax anthurii TaxID=78229 RepID=A0A328Z1S4_9BURK|nr:cupin domain-containing protein [Paracidovorax anthurii]RAR79694.1 transcriptional regulator [Paracidovorax anthurii]